jgi:diguanylate cyclase (GGDEF)-like protein/PAS domain S-box-containing protein
MFGKRSFGHKIISDLKNLPNNIPFKIAITYALAGVLWILLSDELLYMFVKTENTIGVLQILKGLVYVAVTAFLLYRTIVHYIKHIKRYDEQLDISQKGLRKLNEKVLEAEIELDTKYVELQNKDNTIRLLKEKYESIVEGTSDTVWEWDIASGTVNFTERLSDILGYSLDGNLNYTTFINIVHPNDRLKLITSAQSCLSDRLSYFHCEFRMKPRIGDYKWILGKGKSLTDEDGNINKIIGSLSDITDNKESEEKLVKLVYYDYLTGFQNRILFEERLGNILFDAKKNKKKGSILFIDLDDFKKINDSLGHDFGDQLIKLSAQMLSLTVGQNDEVCRFGGDEFIIFHPHGETEIDDVELSKKILDIFSSPFEIGEMQVYASVSIGIATYPKDGLDVCTILKNADAAMYMAKRTGKNAYCFYNQGIMSEIIKENELAKLMRTAIENSEFYLCYQPQYDIKTGKVTSLEALIRWNCPEYGTVSPAKFISIAEETGFIIKIGEWVLKDVCRQSKEWKNKGHKFDRICINISPKQLKHIGFLDMVKNVLAEFSVSTNDIEFEITENVLIEPFHQSIEILEALKYMGIKIALDDFGTGYSSLSYLKMLPINSLKIDKSFVDNICTSSDGISIVDGIISLSHKMNLTVIAEGIETEDQFNLLKERQCDKIQGYFISKPLSVEDVERLLEKQ